MDLIFRWTQSLVDNPEFRKPAEYFLVQGTFPVFVALLLLTLIFWLPRLTELRRSLREMPRGVQLALGAVCLLGAGLRLGWIPHTPQVYFDEFNFLELGRGMLKGGEALVPGWFGAGPALVPIPAAWSFFLSLVFMVTGPSLGAALGLALTLAILSLPLAFLLGWNLFRRHLPALTLTLLLALFPVHLRMSGSLVLETGSFFFLLATWVALLRYQADNHPVWLYCAGTAAAWCANWRMENPFVVLPLLAMCFLVLAPQGLRALREKHVYLVLMGVFLFSLPGLVSYILGTGQGFYLFYDSEAVRLEQVRMNQVNNLLYWFEGRIHPPEITALALLGALAWRPRRAALAWTLWVVVLQVFYSQIPSADFGLHHALDSWRNALQPALGFMVLAVAGLEVLREGLERRFSGGWVAVVLGVALLVPCTWPIRYGDFVHSRHVWQEEFYFMQEVAARLPTGARLLAEGHRDHLRCPELHTAELGYATGRDWQRLELSEEAFEQPGVGAPPVFFGELVDSKKVGQRTFLYYFGMRSSDWDYRRRTWLHDHLQMRIVAGIALPNSGGICFTLYEVVGLSEQGQAWLRAFPRPRGGSH
ncbi:MAG: glycosyltransferase family 39 protein [Candidatus Xenobium sp.]|jgi:hypothetical protein|nr:hypothetical protein [Burkholderiales bacterium]